MIPSTTKEIFFIFIFSPFILVSSMGHATLVSVVGALEFREQYSSNEFSQPQERYNRCQLQETTFSLDIKDFLLRIDERLNSREFSPYRTT